MICVALKSGFKAPPNRILVAANAILASWVCALMVVLILLVVSLASARNPGTDPPQFGRGSSNQSRMERPVNKKRLESSRPQAEPRLIFCAPNAALLFRRGFPLCETRCPRLIQCSGYGSLGVRLSDLLVNGAIRLIGTGRMVVVLCALEISFIVCKKSAVAGRSVARKSSMPPARVFERPLTRLRRL